jgi:hypothetical protein
MDRVLMVSSDGHAGIPTDQYADYADPRDREAFEDAVRIHRARVGEYLVEFSKAAAGTRYLDPVGRVADLEADGVVAEVL